ncbi:hypothetical protein [Bacillus pumilus]|uniref:Uncharacterized protein n=1 Tax=Bacillus pumilus TaxID=1408 RepID=A0AAD0HN99_BACPU|nr:hypothetical protein [Bacillus pumilus]AVM24064.1 hypothetical protein C5695_09510 [Bacillus pumilus]TYS31102.1 hypothetical protein FZC65_12910 [Bacillus pumilus]TYS39435.1 hypothetical protein FZC68_20355 [Bacillus pumilus]TYS46068.1 hypothetical protein FZC67_12480 [Bacillus pumilus]
MEKAVSCEACQKNDVNVIEETDEPNQPYQLCHLCHRRLVTYSLRPLEWYNLAVIHSPKQFLLHDDFYGEGGQAFQLEVDVVVTKDDKAPILQDVRYNLASLLNFSITRWFLENDVIDALKQHDEQKLLDAVLSRFYGTNHVEVKSRMIEIAADVLGPSAAGWIRELLGEADETFLYPLSWAAASSLPANEGLQQVIEKMKSISEKELPTAAFICLHRFRSDKVLDWMEITCTHFHEQWGRLAAVSCPTWSRMKAWLSKGRPFSTIALDTMANCAKGNKADFLEQFSPKILETDKSEVESILNDYQEKDRVPRVKKNVSNILNNKQDIFE